MFDYFKQEVVKLKKANYLLRTDLEATKEENTQLTEHAMSVEASYKVLKQNVSSMSQNNMKHAVTATRQKEIIANLKKEMKKAKSKHATELRKAKEERERMDKQHVVESRRLDKELARLRNIIANYSDLSDRQQSRAHFQTHPNQASGEASMSRSSSMADLSAISMSETSSSGGEWNRDGYHVRYKGPGPSSLQAASWTVVEKKKRMRKPKSSKELTTPRGRYTRQDHWASKKSKFTSPRKSPYAAPNNSKTPPRTPTSSLAAAAATKPKSSLKQKLPSPPLLPAQQGSSLAKAASSATSNKHHGRK